ncbi:hypothetical protein ASPACDRAFT_60108 [Aspergillus aculeatus ATCC 16872]|uniref:Uncharacterized protein n=1 Tax=Aspergillus aculeatus (strain ATCC 16872 / CBS 172.66 / WB 5094) TaxID=690307 RepID=A0A1L9WVJ7_ASPA1|nr:uncharacterized protein ASPACDRAFT_60108 [Aspergillus aculeatus ATCC 16872]OJK00262.1 hypothetical protein ASPACDRAFT_60108 [Aspergillus aculeatus ATCC 16872]
MYCQQRFVALLHALLSVISNSTQEHLPLIPHQVNQTDKPWIGCSNPRASISNYIAVSESPQPGGPGCTITLGHPEQWKADPMLDRDAKDTIPVKNVVEPGLKLTLTITNIERGSLDLQKCQSIFEELIVEGPGNLLQQPTLVDRSLAAFPVGEHSDQIASKSLKPRQVQEYPPEDHPITTPASDPHSLGYHGILEYLLGKEKGTKTSKRAIEHSNAAMTRTEHRRSSVRQSSHSLNADCENICDGHNWRNTHIAKPFLGFQQRQCVICHPDTNVVRVDRRRPQKANELDVFYKICAVFGASVMVATLLYILREIYRRLRVRYLLLRGRNHRDQRAPSIAIKTDCSIPADEMTTRMPEASRAWERSSQASDMVGAQVSASDSATQQRYRRFTPSQRNTRRRVQDIFDFGSSQACKNNLTTEERVPVLPPAANASVRRNVGIWQAPKGQRCAVNEELEGITHSNAFLF